jgi:hypothetical protein
LTRDERLFGFQQNPEVGTEQKDALRASDTGYGHATNSRTKMDNYYTPEMLEKVKRLYKYDYQLWELVNDEQLHTGRELARSMSDECRVAATD